MPQPVIIEAVRTPFGRKGGAYRDERPDTLLAHALAGLAQRAKIAPEKIEDVVTGCVTQAGEQGANIGRLAVLLAGFPIEVPAVTLNRMCGSAQQAIHFAAQEIAAGDAAYAIGAGVEHMTRVPMLSDIGSIDKMNPLLFERFDLIHQGESAERLAEKYKITRRDVDEFSMESHRRASRAASEQHNKELLPTSRSRATKASATSSIRPRSLRCRRSSGPTATASSRQPTAARFPTARPRCSWPIAKPR